ncbi:MAG TPA: DinB family protein [Gemmatimonadaceae bacterium]|nr:DinB family protein [Gemmatimonadaceae bacterium]
MPDLLLRLVRHMRWADSVVADVLAPGDPSGGEATRLFAHIASVEHLWYARIVGRPAEHAVWPSLDLTAARALAARHAELFERLVSDADASSLGRSVEYRNSAGRDYHNTIADIVLHTTVHGEHHRGQIARLIRAAGGDPPHTDYILFARRDQ